MFIDTVEQYLDHRSQVQAIHLKGNRNIEIVVPCANTILVNRNLVVANTYNPNYVSRDKLELLRQSILDNGFAFPVVVIWDDVQELFVVIDGFHRYVISGPDWLGLRYVPVAVLTHDSTQRMVATWQFNKARGSHQVDLDADLIRSLIQQGMSEKNIAQHLGIDMDTVHRYKQITGIAEIFKNAEYSLAWYMEDKDG